MITALSLPFSSLNSIQVVVRLGNGVEDSSLSLEPVLPILSSRSGSDTGNIFSDPSNKMHFQLCNEGGENLLRVFAMVELERSPPQCDPPLLQTPANDLHLALTVPVSNDAGGQIAMQDHVYLDYDEFDLNYSTMCDRFPESHPSEYSQHDTGDIRNLFNFDVESTGAFHASCSPNVIPALYGSQAPPTNQDEDGHRGCTILPYPALILSSPALTPLSSSLTPSSAPSSSVAGSPFLGLSSHHSLPEADSMPMEDDPRQTVSPKTRACKRRKLSCTFPGCNRRFTSNYTLKLHVDAHSPKERLWFPCTAGCSERFSRQHDRLRHEVAKHGKVCEWVCDDCNRFFSSNRTLLSHKCPNGVA